MEPDTVAAAVPSEAAPIESGSAPLESTSAATQAAEPAAAASSNTEEIGGADVREETELVVAKGPPVEEEPSKEAAAEALVGPAEAPSEAANGGSAVQGAAPEDGAQEDAVEPPCRLFVGCVPYTFTEAELKPYFDQFEGVRDVVVLRDRLTGASKGCAFVIFQGRNLAQAAIDARDKTITLPGSNQPMEVRFARESALPLPSDGPKDNRQLFFANAPTTFLEDDIKQVFQEFGKVTEVSIFKFGKTGASKGCGFVFYAERAQAQAAFDALNGKRTLGDSALPLSVKWADPDLHNKKRKIFESDPNSDNNQVFFTRVPRDIKHDELKKLFEAHGTVLDVNIFKASQNAPSNKGCGIVTMGSHEEAEQVLEQLDLKHTFEGLEGPMMLKWVDQELQKRRKLGHTAGGFGGGYGMPQAGGFGGFGGQMAGAGEWQSPHGGPGPRAHNDDKPPAGADPDTYKLFLARIPVHLSLEEVTAILEQFGKVLDCKLVRDHQTQQSRGLAYVWYSTKSQADAAVAGLGEVPLTDAQGNPKRIAAQRSRPRGPPGGPQQGGGGFQGGFVGGQGSPQGRGRPAPYYPPSGYSQPQPPAYARQQPPTYGQPPQGYSAYHQQAPAYRPPAANPYQPQAAAAPATYQQLYATATQPYAAGGGYAADPAYNASQQPYGAQPAYADPSQQAQQYYDYSAQPADASAQPSYNYGASQPSYNYASQAPSYDYSAQPAYAAQPAYGTAAAPATSATPAGQTAYATQPSYSARPSHAGAAGAAPQPAYSAQPIYSPAATHSAQPVTYSAPAQPARRPDYSAASTV